MNFPSKGGVGRVFYNGAFYDAAWAPDATCDYMTHVILSNGTELDFTDYEDRLDYIYAPSDDGNTFYNTMVLLSPGEQEVVIPTAKEMLKNVATGMMPILDKFYQGDIEACDVAFCKNIFTIPACLYRTFVQTGSLDKAHTEVLKSVFDI